jgi:AraC family transcriptional regulator
MQTIGKALWYIESHIGEPFTLDDVAHVSGLSRFHLARTFAGIVGQPVLAYARGRRLSEAARLLADGAPDILQVALAVGYGSHEAFTRAFRDRFGITPEDVRARRTLANLAMTEPVRMPDQTPTPTAPDRFVSAKAMLFVGLRRYFRFEERAGIASLWHAFGPHLGSITNTIPGAAYGLCLAPADPSDEAGFDYAPAVEVSSLSDLPEGLSGIRIAPRAWAIFRHAGHVATLGATCAAAGEWLAGSGRQPADCAMQMIERYGPEFDASTGNGGCEVWIPVLT